jgi:hypothetical protein
MGDMHQYLVEHPGLIPLLGFAVTRSRAYPEGFNPQANLPTQRHLTYMLRKIPNSALQFLLNDSVRLIRAELRKVQIEAGDCINLDTKHILAWVKENNPKAYVENRFDKTKQPKGDPDCKLGCKRRHNQHTSKAEFPATPKTNPLPADTIQVGEFYWGYGSGVVVVKVPEYGEFIMAEITQPFNQPDLSYFSRSWREPSRFWVTNRVLALSMPLLTPGMSTIIFIERMIPSRLLLFRSRRRVATRPKAAFLARRDYLCVKQICLCR